MGEIKQEIQKEKAQGQGENGGKIGRKGLGLVEGLPPLTREMDGAIKEMVKASNGAKSSPFIQTVVNFVRFARNLLGLETKRDHPSK